MSLRNKWVVGVVAIAELGLLLLLHPLTNEGLPSPFFTVLTALQLHSTPIRPKRERRREGRKGSDDETNECSIYLCCGVAASRVDIVCSHEQKYSTIAVASSRGIRHRPWGHFAPDIREGGQHRIAV